MRKMWIFIGVAAVLILLVSVWHFQPEVRRYRLVVDVDTPTGRRSSSTVIETIMGRKLPIMGTSPVYFQTRGEAVALPLGDERVLYVLLVDEATQFELPWFGARHGTVNPALSRTFTRGETRPLWKAIETSNARVTLAPRDYPKVVVFSPAARKPLREIAMDQPDSDFAPGYRIAQIYIVPTTLPVPDPTIQAQPIWTKNGGSGIWNHRRYLLRGHD